MPFFVKFNQNFVAYLGMSKSLEFLIFEVLYFRGKFQFTSQCDSNSATTLHKTFSLHKCAQCFSRSAFRVGR